MNVFLLVFRNVGYLGATGLFTNRKYLSPINIDESKSVPIRANLVLNPDPFGNYPFTTERNEQDGVRKF